MSGRPSGYNRHLQTIAAGGYEATPESTERRRRQHIDAASQGPSGRGDSQLHLRHLLSEQQHDIAPINVPIILETGEFEFPLPSAVVNDEEHVGIDEGNVPMAETADQTQMFDSHCDFDPLIGGTGSEPIYPGSTCSKGQLVSLMLAFHLRFLHSKESLQALIELFTTVIPDCMCNTKYFFDRYFFEGTKGLAIHYLCPECHKYMGRDNSNRCDTCDLPFQAKECVQKGSFLLTKSIESQLKDMLESGSVLPYIDRKNSTGNSFGEINSGLKYRALEMNAFLANSDNFSMSFNTDGVQVFNSSTYQIWPIFASLNDIPSRNKSRFILLHTLWFGLAKLRSDSFLRPFVEEGQKLFRDGFEWCDSKGTLRTSRVMFNIFIADAPARAHVLDRTQFNGEHGCEFCEHPGVSVEKGAGHVRVYPLTINAPICRTHETVLEYAKLATRYNIPVLGVKGPSMCFLLHGFDMVRSIIPDSMHNLWLGISVQFRKLWETSHGKPFYVKDLNLRIDNYLLSTKTSLDILRVPRSLQQHSSDWKASENRDFVLFLSPVILKFVLDKEFYDHWMLFVSGCRLLFRSVVSYEDTIIASKLFEKFILLTAELYGKEHVTYNIHLLQHLPQSVTDWGAPWASSAFLFESAGGDLTNFFHGSRYVPQQIFTGFLAKRKLRSYAKRYIGEANEPIKQLYGRLDRYFNFNAHSGVQCLGKCREYLLLDRYSQAVNCRLNENVHDDLSCSCDEVLSYERLAFNGKIFSTERYASNFQRDNSIVRHSNSAMYRIQEIIRISHSISCCFAELGESTFLIGKCVPLCHLPPKVDDHAKYDINSCIHKVDKRKKEDVYFALRPEEILNRAIIISKDDECFVVDCNLRTEND